MKNKLGFLRGFQLVIILITAMLDDPTTIWAWVAGGGLIMGLEIAIQIKNDTQK